MDKEQMKKPPQPDEYRAKPTWQRFLIITGGVIMNFILAVIIFASTLYVWGEQYLPVENMKYGIAVNSIGKQMGLQDGDKIISIGGKKVERFSEIPQKIIFADSNTITIERNNIKKSLTVSDSIISNILEQRNQSFIYPRIPLIVTDFIENAPAKKAGLQKGDSIIAVNNESVQFHDQIQGKLTTYANDTITVTVLRNGSQYTIPMQLNKDGKMGVYFASDLNKIYDLKTIKYGFLEAVPAGINKGVNTITQYVQSMKLLFRPETEAHKSIGGPVAIGSIFPGTWNWQALWGLTAFLSIIIGVVNILPIPALDGGHLMFIIFEMITGRKPSDKFMEYAQVIGFAILLSLMLLVTGNDIIRLITN